MVIPTLIMGLLAVALLALGYSRGEGEHLQGLRSGFGMILEIVPLLLFAFIVAGMVQVLLPRDLIAKWVGAESGIRGILIGTVAGGLSPGGPYVSLPIVAGLLRTGAGVPPGSCVPGPVPGPWSPFSRGGRFGRSPVCRWRSASWAGNSRSCGFPPRFSSRPWRDGWPISSSGG